jgi:hypothetical protein
MHSFTELAQQTISFMLKHINNALMANTEALKNSGATSLVKTTQILNMQRTVMVVGLFSIFEAALQNRLECKSGFDETRTLLRSEGLHQLEQIFTNYQRAINVLKHGEGPSYQHLLSDASHLPFRIKRPGEHLFNEGDVSEISTLVLVDDEFVVGCARIIDQVSEAIQGIKPQIFL